MTDRAAAPAPEAHVAELSEAVRRLSAGGLDLVQPFDLGRWSANGRLSLGPPGRLGLVIGNTRALWPALHVALDGVPPETNPVDAHCERVVRDALDALPVLGLWLAPDRVAPNGEPLPIQQIAQAAGLAQIGPCHLSVHAVHGPWIALRAIAAIDWRASLATPEPSVDVCAGCHQPCVPALERALTTTQRPLSSESVRSAWPAWLAVRDACPVGRASRYGDEQLRYHYTGAGWPRSWRAG